MAVMATIPLSYKPVTQADLFLVKSLFDARRLGYLPRFRTQNFFPPLVRQNAGKGREDWLCRGLRADVGRNDEKNERWMGAQEPIRTLILDNYDSYTYNLFQLLSVINGVAPVVLKNDEITFEQLRVLLYEERAFHNVVISPGPGSPMRAEDIGISMQLLQECPDIPILGVCLGHQALGCCHGAKVVHAPEPVHGRLSEIKHNGHPLFINIPSGAGSGFKVVRYHSLVIDAASVPEDLIPTAWTMLSDGPAVDCPNGSSTGLLNGSSNENGVRLQSPSDRETGMVMHLEDGKLVWRRQSSLSDLVTNGTNGKPWMAGAPAVIGTKKQEVVLMAMSHRSRPHHGVQFHPESVATAHGKQILENFCNITREYWQKQAWQPACKSTEAFWKLVLPIEEEQATAHLQDIVVKGAVQEAVPEMRIADVTSPIALRLHWQKLSGYAGTAGGSESIFCALFGNEAAEDTFWLDSSTREQGGARFSYMGGRGGLMWRHVTYSLGGTGVSGIVRIKDASGNVEEHYLEEGFFQFLDKEMESCSCAVADYEELPFDFCGGFVGYLGYELKVECGARSNQHKSSLPDAALFLADRAVVIDHSNDDVYVLSLFQDPSSLHDLTSTGSKIDSSNGKPRRPETERDGASCNGCHALLNSSLNVNGRSHHIGLRQRNIECEKNAAEAWVTATVGRISMLGEKGVDLASERRHSSRFSSSIDTGKDKCTPPFTLQKSRSTYINDIDKCKHYIYDGESYEVCLTTQLRRETQDLDTLGLYLTLRKTNPAPYASWLHFGKDGPQVCCSSPERFLRLDRGGTLEAKPIKGTLPRGSSPVEDERLRYELQHSEKDYAENLMIVDLLRNDLGRVSVPGSVYVPSLMTVESYTTVHTLVSTVRGEKREDVTPIQCIKAAFPGGSMTGAPKLRTMEILDTIESGPRGIYSGTVGFFSFNSSFDLNIVIRTLVFSDGEVCIGAGGAVTALSDPEAEYEEMLLKTRAPIRAMAKFEGEFSASNSRGHRGAASAIPT